MSLLISDSPIRHSRVYGPDFFLYVLLTVGLSACFARLIFLFSCKLICVICCLDKRLFAIWQQNLISFGADSSISDLPGHPLRRLDTLEVSRATCRGWHHERSKWNGRRSIWRPPTTPYCDSRGRALVDDTRVVAESTTLLPLLLLLPLPESGGSHRGAARTRSTTRD